MAIGMTYEQFWYGDNVLCEFYYKAHIEKIKMRNEELYLSGCYTFQALETALANAFREKGRQPTKYLEKPFDILPKSENEKEKQTREEREKAIAFFEKMRTDWENGSK